MDKLNNLNDLLKFIDYIVGDHKSPAERTVKKFDEIKGISYCDTKGKEKVIVIFKDGSKVIKEMNSEDNFDLNVGVALCLADHLFGSKTQFHKEVQSKLVASKKKEKVDEGVSGEAE